ncbi:MAG: peptidylprolyl isomerase [Bacteroidaceae bacterium]|nr:peptidylprolyl isomerase [Bacteroidaceae bacterium]
MKILNKYLSVFYDLYVMDSDKGEEERVEGCDRTRPLVFISKMGFALKPFEEQLELVEAGNAFDFTIPAKDAYGEYDDELVFNVDIKQFEKSEGFNRKHLFEGNVINVYGPDGQVANALILEVGEDSVTLDLNHPHAGNDLHFKGEVLENRLATNDEIAAFVNMMSGGCGGGCGNCGGGCGGNCDGGDCEGGGCGSSGGCCN